jgi:hypothetical protein
VGGERASALESALSGGAEAAAAPGRGGGAGGRRGGGKGTGGGGCGTDGRGSEALVQAELGAENLGGLADGEADEGVQGVVGSGGGQAESEEGGARARELLTGRTDREPA